MNVRRECEGIFQAKTLLFFGFLRVFVHVFARRHAVHLLEDGGEGGGIAEAAGIHHFRDVHIAGGE